MDYLRSLPHCMWNYLCKYNSVPVVRVCMMPDKLAYTDG